MQARALTFRLVRLAMAASLILPFLLFAFASWTSYRSFQALTDERLARSLDVEQEEASKTFQLVALALDSVSDLVAGMSDLQIAQDQERIYPRLQNLSGPYPLSNPYGFTARTAVSWSPRGYILHQRTIFSAAIFS